MQNSITFNTKGDGTTTAFQIKKEGESLVFKYYSGSIYPTTILTIPSTGGTFGSFLKNQTTANSTDTIKINEAIFNPSNLRVLNTSLFVIESSADYYVLGDLINSGSIVLSGSLKVGGGLYLSGSITGPGTLE